MIVAIERGFAEIRLNRPWAPDIYLNVVPITMQGGQPLIGGDGTAVEYAVRMCQFKQDQRLDAELLANKLSAQDMGELAESIARRHQAAEVLGPDERGPKMSHIRGDMWDNLDALEGLLAAKKLRALRQWTGKEQE